MRVTLALLATALIAISGGPGCCWAADQDFASLLQAAATMTGTGTSDAQPAPISDAEKLALALASVQGSSGSASTSKDAGTQTVRGDLGKTLMTRDLKQGLLDLINGCRAQVARGQVEGWPPAAGMALCEWDDQLARTAFDWARQCTCADKPDAPENRLVSGLTHVAQVVVPGWLTDISSLVGSKWCSQARNWDPAAGACRAGTVCQDFLTVAAGPTRFVGCGLADCPSKTGCAVQLVCNFAACPGPAPATGLPPYVAAPVGVGCRACRAGGCSRCLCGLCADEGAVVAAGGACAATEAPKADDSSVPTSTTRLCGPCDSVFRPENTDKIVARVVASGTASSAANP